MQPNEQVETLFVVDSVGPYTVGVRVRAINLPNLKYVEGVINLVDSTLNYIKILVSDSNIDFDSDPINEYNDWAFHPSSPAGNNGATGATGPIGYTGSQGIDGVSTDRGYTGSQGDSGYAGSIGSSGAIGYAGSQGVLGYAGSAGAPGFPITITGVGTIVAGQVKSHSNVGLSGGTLRISGSGYQAPLEAILGTPVNQLISQDKISVVSSSAINVKIPSASVGQYYIMLVNSQGQAAVKLNAVNYINVSGPTWITNSKLPDQLVGQPTDIQLSASTAVGYALETGSTVPSALTLYGNGRILGSIVSSLETTYTFTVSAYNSFDIETPRTFSLSTIASIIPTWNSVSNLFGSTYPIQDVVNVTLGTTHYRVICTASAGVFVGRIATSTDGGLTWTIRSGAATALLNRSIWSVGPKMAPNIDTNTVSPNILLAGTDTNRIAWTRDLTTWTVVIITNWPTSSYVTDIVYSHTNGIYLAVGGASAAAVSTNGTSWTYTNTLITAWGGSFQAQTAAVDRLGRIWVGGQSGKLASTTNGSVWVTEPINSTSAWAGNNTSWNQENINVILHGANGELIIAGALGSVAYASGGWRFADNISTLRQSGSWQGGCQIGQVFYLLSQTNVLARSTDGGKTWTTTQLSGSDGRAMVGPVKLGPINASRTANQNAVAVAINRIYYSQPL